MQYPGLAISIIGVNEVGHEAGNEGMCEGRDLPWLQDTSEADWWGEWAPTYRDVIIVDGDGGVASVYNLTEHDLADEASYVELKTILIEIAEAEAG